MHRSRLRTVQRHEHSRHRRSCRGRQRDRDVPTTSLPQKTLTPLPQNTLTPLPQTALTSLPHYTLTALPHNTLSQRALSQRSEGHLGGSREGRGVARSRRTGAEWGGSL